ncbi:MAG: hypothetical protein J6866_08055 [Victivallales bacterium]|nr:hypothetical protein [Victivallales bacterium]
MSDNQSFPMPPRVCQLTKDGLHLSDDWRTAADDEYIVGIPKSCPELSPSQALQAFRQDGFPGWGKFDGAFALVCYQRSTGQLHLAIDRFAFAELFYTAVDGKLVFSSSLSALLAIPGISRDLSPQGLTDYLGLGYVTAPSTIYRNIWRAVAGGVCTFTASSCTFEYKRYWMPDYTAHDHLAWQEAIAQAKDKINARLTAALTGRKTAVLLSGGIDSSLLTALACEQGLPPEAAFTAIYGDERYDEGTLAAQVADRYHIPHQECHVTPASLDSVLSLLHDYGEPFADSSLLPLSALLRTVATAGFSSVLCGDGGDELFGGYRRYQAMLWRHVMSGLPAALAKFAGKCLLPFLPAPQDNRSRLANLTRSLRSLTLPPIEAYISFQELFSREMRRQLLADSPETDYLDIWQSEGQIMNIKDAVERYNNLDLLHYLPEDGCRKGLVANLQTGITCLAPLLSSSLLEWVMSLPRHYKTTLTDTKRLLKAIGTDLLPAQLLHRRKTGFGIPVATWLRGPWREQLRWLSESPQEWVRQGLFNHQVVKRLVSEHLEGRANHDARLWALLLFARFLEGR